MSVIDGAVDSMEMLDGGVMSYELTSNLGGRLSGSIEDGSLL